MGKGFLFEQLNGMEGATAAIFFKGKQKPLKDVKIVAINLQHGLGLFVLIENPHGTRRRRLITPNDHISHINYDPVESEYHGESLESLAGDVP